MLLALYRGSNSNSKSPPPFQRGKSESGLVNLGIAASKPLSS
ncbi:hypothetical protein [Lysobacter gummosus]